MTSSALFIYGEDLDIAKIFGLGVETEHPPRPLARNKTVEGPPKESAVQLKSQQTNSLKLLLFPIAKAYHYFLGASAEVRLQHELMWTTRRYVLSSVALHKLGRMSEYHEV